jgi:tetratricopeptide (TPR) repeat protein
MRTAGWRTVIIACSLIVGARLVAAPVIQEADQAWQHRDQAGETEAAIRLWKKALITSPKDPSLLIRLTRACGRAYRHTDDKEARRRWAEQARDFGARAVAAAPEEAEAYAEYAAALGQWAQSHKGVGALKIVKEAVANLNKAVSLQPDYAYAHMLLAEFYEESPGWLSVGDKNKALLHARLAVEHGGNYAINRVTYAKILLHRGQKAEARQQLEKAIALRPPEDAVPETRADQQTAKEMLKKL